MGLRSRRLVAASEAEPPSSELSNYGTDEPPRPVAGGFDLQASKGRKSAKRFAQFKICRPVSLWFYSPVFVDALEQLHTWRREHLPGADTPQGAELLVWILKAGRTRAPLKELYRSSRFSEPTVRARLNAFIEHGLVVIELDANDSRKHLIRNTAKLDMIVAEYIKRIDDVAKAP